MSLWFTIDIAHTQVFNNTGIEWYEFQEPMIEILKTKTVHTFPQKFSKIWDRLIYKNEDETEIEYDLYARLNTRELSIEYMVMLSYPKPADSPL